MEAKELELTVEDITLMYRGWITKLFLADDKTDVEIVELLYERRLLVTVAKIRKCLQDWELIPLSSPPANIEPEEESQSTSDDSWEMVQRCVSLSPKHLPALDSPTYVPPTTDPELPLPSSPFVLSPLEPPRTERTPTATDPDPEVVDLYKTRPLPSIPVSKQKKRKSCERSPNRDKLKLTCYHGLESHEVETSLDSLFPQGPSPIETYATDDQAHERLAIGLKGSYRRSGQVVDGVVGRETPTRFERMKRRRKLAGKKENDTLIEDKDEKDGRLTESISLP